MKGRGRKPEVRDQKPRTMTDLVREAAKELGEFCLQELQYADYDRYMSRAQIRGALGGLKRIGEIVMIEPDKFRYRGIAKERTKLEVVWHLIRSHRSFSTDEIERLSGAARGTVLDYLSCFGRAGYIRNIKKGHWQLVKDPGPGTPVTTWGCKKLQGIRQEKSAALSGRSGSVKNTKPGLGR
ncbi:MAG: hypothetical protein JW944_07850 [Deltaproteobacteria bacterium]|nr:hypothetical protein [Deltaproteobacteria bacterium]